MPDPPPRKRQPPDLSPSGPPAQVRGSAYAELHCKSNFSFLEGGSHPDELVRRAAELGLSALAVTDRNSLAGVVRAHKAAKEIRLELIIGAEIVPADAPPVVLLATDRAAYGRLSRLITLGRRRMPKGECLITAADIADHAEGLIALALPGDRPADCDPRVYRRIFGADAFLTAELSLGPDEGSRLAELRALSERCRMPLVAAGDVHYHHPDRRYLQDVLTCIREGCTLAKAGRRLFANADRHLKSPAEMAARFAACPEAVSRSAEIAERCRFRLDELRYEYPAEICPPGETPISWLTELTWKGAAERYPAGIPDKVRRLLEQELALIADLKYEPFFLTVWDIVRFAESRGILCQGRGSAANSAVCYCLRVTAVDPDLMDTLFERFVSRERNEPPDIDVDFEHERREEVFQYIYGKYGRDRAGITAEVISYRTRSAVRDVGKALGLSLDRIDVLAKTMDVWGEDEKLRERIVEAGLDPDEYVIRCLVGLVREIADFPRHLSQHVGGFVITAGRLDEVVPVGNGGMPDRTFIEWDKDDIDALGILKVDCLALGMLTCIKKCFDLVDGGGRGGGERRRDGETESSNSASSSLSHDTGIISPSPRLSASPSLHPSISPSPPLLSPALPAGEGALDPALPRRRLTLANVPAEDPAVYEMIGRADTVGVFQIESRAQMSMLPRLKPNCFYDLVIEVAIVRPGPIQGGMVHPYLRRRRGEEPVSYPNDAVKAVLHKTLGVPLFQEQAMRLAVVAAGFTPGEADQLRRAMGAWRKRGVMDKFRTKLLDGMRANGLPDEFAERVYLQLQGFGEYGFPESHAASFARLVYVSAWLKRYHPAEFAAALINSQPMGFYQPAQIVRDAREHGVRVLPPDVNESDWDCTLEPPSRSRLSEAPFNPSPALRLGFRLILGLPREQAERLLAARATRRFRSLNDLVRRTGPAGESLLRLAAADAFGSLALDRRSALWQAMHFRLRDDLPLFADLDDDEPVPELPAEPMLRQVSDDYHAIGLSLKAHPMGLIRGELDGLGALTAERIAQLANGRPARAAGLVLVRQRPGTARGITFFTLEDETGVVNLIVRPEVFSAHRRAARTAAALIADGTIQRDGIVVHVLVTKLQDLAEPLLKATDRSRNFR